MTVRRLRVPQQALADPRIAEVAVQAEDTFVSTRYRDALAREIEIGATPEERADWERQLSQRLAQFGGRSEAVSNLPPSLIFEPSRLFCRDIAQVATLTNVSFFLPLLCVILFLFCFYPWPDHMFSLIIVVKFMRTLVFQIKLHQLVA